MADTTAFDIIERMAALIRSEERKKCAESGLQLVHFQVLDYLSRCNKYSDTPAALANYLGMTRGTVSQTVLLLYGKGYLNKTVDLRDRRVVHLSLLPAGEEILAQVRSEELFSKAGEILRKEDIGQHYDEILLSVLNALQKSNQSYTFGVCKTCKFFTPTVGQFLCGLTKEALNDRDSEKICQEHSVL